jgi:hypothetical protein
MKTIQEKMGPFPSQIDANLEDPTMNKSTKDGSQYECLAK